MSRHYLARSCYHTHHASQSNDTALLYRHTSHVDLARLVLTVFTSLRDRSLSRRRADPEEHRPHRAGRVHARLSRQGAIHVLYILVDIAFIAALPLFIALIVDRSTSSKPLGSCEQDIIRHSGVRSHGTFPFHIYCCKDAVIFIATVYMTSRAAAADDDRRRTSARAAPSCGPSRSCER